MYAIVDVKDKQFKVRENETVYVPHHAELESGDSITLDRVLLVSNGDGDVSLGTPTVEGATVEASVVDQVKGDKVIVFKKKRRKRYRVKRGHRQKYTKIRIDALHAGNGAVPPAEDTAPVEEEAPSDDAAPADTAPADTAPAEAASTEETVSEETASEETASEETASEETASVEDDAPVDTADAETAEADAESPADDTPEADVEAEADSDAKPEA
jgi:large subunit ribosomal protein L21